MERILETHQFGPHRADVLELADDESSAYVVLVDGAVVTDVPLPAPPSFEELVRIYARSRKQGRPSA